MRRSWWLVVVILYPGFWLKAEEARPVLLTGEVIDSDSSKPLPARVYIQGEDGQWYFPHSQAKEGSAVPYKKQRPGKSTSVEMHTTLSPHPFAVELPPGQYTITVERGHEYHPETQRLTIADKAQHVTIKLRRWIDMARRGWYSGDTHVHRGLDELPNVMLAEDLNVAFPLLYWVTEAYAPPRGSPRSTTQDPEARPIAVDATHVIYPRNTEYEIFTINKKPHALGAFFIINHKTLFDRGVPPVRAIGKQAHEEGALLELDKPNWPWSMILAALLKVDLYELANNHVWRTEFGFPGFGEAPAEYMKVQRDARGFTEWGWLDFNFQNYYALLNCGFRMRPTAGTASGVHPVPLGFGRVYVKLEESFAFDRWYQGLGAGRSFVTTGPMLLVEVNGQSPGQVFQQADPKPRTYRLTGTAVSGRPLKNIDIVVNGAVVRILQPENRPTKGGGHESGIDVNVAIDSSAWLVVRCFEDRPDGRVRFAHTAPFHFVVPTRPLRPRRVEIDYLIKRVEDQIGRSKEILPAAALAEYEEALGIYRDIAKTAR